jgi:hypothetical protein
MKELEFNYKKLQKKLHPDLFSSKSLVPYIIRLDYIVIILTHYLYNTLGF